MPFDSNPETRNPLKYEDVAWAMAQHWAVSESVALKYARTFGTPRDALHNLRDNLQMPPAEFWESL